VTDLEPSLDGRRCLVLDDEFLIALDIQQILETAGADVTCVGDAAAALAALRDGAFDIAVLDVKLSDAGGTSLSVAAVLAEQGTPFVFLTGMRGDDIHMRQFPNAPLVDKPYQAERLMEALRRALSAK
jgi:CheY-like chemotaxis protein